MPKSGLASSSFAVSELSFLNIAIRTVIPRKTIPQNLKKPDNVTNPSSRGSLKMYLLLNSFDSNTRKTTYPRNAPAVIPTV